MSLDGEYGDAFLELQSSIQRKRYALEILDSEYTKLCRKSDSYLKHIEELASRLYNLDNYLKSIECRINEYEKQEKVWKKEACALMKSVEELKISFDKENNQTEEDNLLFDEFIFMLVQDARKDREHFDCDTTGNQIDSLQNINASLIQETADINQALIELKQRHPIKPSDEVLFILKNTNLRDFLEPDIKQLQAMKDSKVLILKELKENIKTLEEEINHLSSQ